MIVEKGFDLRLKRKVWGIQLLSGVMVALCCESEMYCQNAEVFAHNLHFKGMPGALPRLATLVDRMRDSNKVWEKNAFNATVKILNQNGIKAENYGGNTWCRCDALYYSFDDQNVHNLLMCFPLKCYRTAIKF